MEKFVIIAQLAFAPLSPETWSMNEVDVGNMQFDSMARCVVAAERLEHMDKDGKLSITCEARTGLAPMTEKEAVFAHVMSQTPEDVELANAKRKAEREAEAKAEVERKAKEKAEAELRAKTELRIVERSEVPEGVKGAFVFLYAINGQEPRIYGNYQFKNDMQCDNGLRYIAQMEATKVERMYGTFTCGIAINMPPMTSGEENTVNIINSNVL